MAKPINLIIADPVKRANLERRFWSKVEKRGLNDCWPWIARARHAFGYGAMNSGRGNQFYSHVASYALHNSPIPDGAYVLHSCDNPGCCNPSHLRLGTHLENALDAKLRGRLIGKTGPSDPSLCARKLNATIAQEIRESRMNRRSLAAQYGISTGTVDNIRAGRTYVVR